MNKDEAKTRNKVTTTKRNERHSGKSLQHTFFLDRIEFLYKREERREIIKYGVKSNRVTMWSSWVKGLTLLLLISSILGQDGCVCGGIESGIRLFKFLSYIKFSIKRICHANAFG